MVGVIGRKAALAHAVVAAKEAAEEAAEADVKARTAVVEAEAEIVRTEKVRPPFPCCCRCRRCCRCCRCSCCGHTSLGVLHEPVVT